MIVSLLIKLIKKGVDGFSNLCAFLLVKLGLWLPTLFCLVYLLACAVMQIKLEGGVVGLFLGGAIACFVIGGFIALKSYSDNYKSYSSSSSKTPYSSVPKSMQNSVLDYPNTRGGLNGERVITGSFEYSQRDVDVDAMQSLKDTRALEESEQPAPQVKRRETTYEKLKERPYKYDDFKDLREKYFQTKSGSGNLQNTDSSSVQSKSNDFKQERQTPIYSNWSSTKELPQDILPRRDRGDFPLAIGNEAKNDRALESSYNAPERFGLRREEPMIFATRRDPNILVYEYSDRLEFYKKSNRGLEFVEQILKR